MINIQLYLYDHIMKIIPYIENNYINFMKISNTSNPEIATFFKQTQAKTAEACGVSEKTVKRITAEGNKSSSESQTACPSFTSPRKTYKRIKFASEVGFGADIVRRIVYDFYDKQWFIQMLQHLEEPSVIVMDNAPYHSVLAENYPKANVQKWLYEKGVEYSPLETLSELQLIWAQVKEDIAKKNVSSKIADVEKLVNEALDAVTVDSWKKYVSHCEKLQEDDFIKEGLRKLINFICICKQIKIVIIN
ncbi:hypothetical protein AGLY_015956 [Aphis glycines]|uniref:Tc1-like transposase DDE domain-containing protein n=1 Tax=Aphis glycines TaxID=307491 RepID=A0A6G0SZL8_APHGL|nr:hypothetical protein AGLY_015956 [Aphis glycines]